VLGKVQGVSIRVARVLGKVQGVSTSVFSNAIRVMGTVMGIVLGHSHPCSHYSNYICSKSSSLVVVLYL
jgi:hypothetical protein